MKKLIFDKKFKPVHINEGDELYPNGIFLFNITKLCVFIKANPDQFPVEEVEIESIRTFTSTNLNETTIKTADTSTPIILAEISPGRFNVVDGNHRVERAFRVGLGKTSAYKVRADQHLHFLTSESAYHAYVNYWNSKVDDAEEHD